MTFAEAVQEVSSRCRAGDHPLLAGDEIERIVRRFPSADDAGRYADEEGYVPTWDLAAAERAGWLAKAAAAAGAYDLTTDGERLDRSQVHAHCLEMASRVVVSAGWA